MRRAELKPGWLREEIRDSVRELLNKPWLTQQQKADFVAAAARVEKSDKLVPTQ